MTPNSVTAVQTNALLGTYDILKPVYVNKLFRKFGDQGRTAFMLMKTLGYEEAIAAEESHHFEENWIHEYFNTRNNVANPTAGNPVNITLDTTNLDANNRFYPQVNDDVMFQNEVVGTITAIDVSTPSAPVITVYPKKVTDNIGALTAGDPIIIYSNTFAPGTDQPDGRVSKPDKYTFPLKISKESFKSDGSSMTSETWFDKMSDGKQLLGYYDKGIQDTEYRLMLQIDGALLFDKKATTPTLTNAELTSIWGLWDWIDQGGNVDPYNIGFYSMNDFDVENNVLDQNFVGLQVSKMGGRGFMTEVKNLFTNSFDDGAIVYNRAGEQQNARELHVGFKSFTNMDRTYHFTILGNFNNPRTYGAPGYPYPNAAFTAPLDMRKDPKSKEEIPSFGCTYKKLGDYSRQLEIWNEGSAGTGYVKTSGVDTKKFNMRAHYGSRYVANNRFYKNTPN